MAALDGVLPELIGAAGAGGGSDAEIVKSLRFDSGASAYLNRTPSSTGNRNTMTISLWYKNTVKTVGGHQPFLAAQFTSPTKDYFTKFTRLDDGRLNFSSRLGGSDTIKLLTTQVLRDAGAWYHLVLAIDTTQATASDRLKLYINGSEVTDFDTATYPSLNQNLDYLNENQLHFIGRYLDNSYEYFDGYLADFYFIDGSALEPTSFGAFDTNGVWQPSLFSGVYGTNGYHLFDFANESTIGHDSSGNENDFTANNFSDGGTPATVYASASPSGKSGFSSSYPSSYLLDGSDTSQAAADYSAGDTTTVVVEFNPAITAGSTLTTKIYQYQTYHSLKVNSGSFVTASSAVVNLLSGHGISAGDSISSITYRTVSPTPSFGLGNEWYYIKNDGVNIQSDPVNNDILYDVCQNDTVTSDTGVGGEISGNYCTFNPLDINSTGTLSNGNLDWSTTNGNGNCRGTIAVSSGKWYWEYYYKTKPSGGGTGFGILSVLEDKDFPGAANAPDGYTYYSEGAAASFTKKYNNGTATDYGAAFAPGDFIGVALDMDAGTITFYRNGVSQGQAFSGISGTYAPTIASGTGVGTAQAVLNTGQRQFAFTAPSGFKALNTAALTASVGDGSDYFDVALYTGNGGTQTISGLNFEGDLFWFKSRSASYDHWLFDSVRGLTNAMYSNSSSANSDYSPNGISATSSTGFTLNGSQQFNTNSATYAGWVWDAGSSTVENTDGSITSQVRANQTAGFSIISYTGTGAINTIGHGLNAVPEMIIVKRTNTSESWGVYHKGITSAYRLVLDQTTTKQSTTTWASTDPTSSVFSVGVATLSNGSGDSYIGYCFAPVEGYSAFGTYVGNYSSDGPFAYTGFRPRFFMWKNVDGAFNWGIIDSERGFNI